jgi:hypothetical protein
LEEIYCDGKLAEELENYKFELEEGKYAEYYDYQD